MRKYTTERGIEIRIKPIPFLLDKVREAHEFPPAPTYAEKTASGNERQVEMTADDMKAAKEHNPDWYAGHAEVWEAYEAEYADSQSVLNEKILDSIALKAAQFDMPADDTWAEEQVWLGLDVPESPVERRIHYFRTEVIGGEKDMIHLMLIASGTEVTEEVLAQATASFRGVIRQQVIDGLAGEGGSVEGEPETDADAGGG